MRRFFHTLRRKHLNVLGFIPSCVAQRPVIYICLNQNGSILHLPFTAINAYTRWKTYGESVPFCLEGCGGHDVQDMFSPTHSIPYKTRYSSLLLYLWIHFEIEAYMACADFSDGRVTSNV